MAVFLVAVAAWWFGSHGLTAESQVRKRSEKLRLVFVDRDPKMARRLISDRYLDQWGMNREQLRLAVNDVTSQFRSLNVEWIDPELRAADGKATITARARVTGRPSTPVGDMMLSAAEGLRQPFVFHWEKEGLWAWTWRLVRIDNVDYELPPDYTPGMFSENRGSLEEALSREAGAR